MKYKDEIVKKTRNYEVYTSQNLSSIVRIPSLCCQEASVIERIGNLCSEAGFDEVRVDGLGNLIARIGSGPKILAIDAHIDTVDVGERSLWEFEPFSGDITSGYVLGRGSVDQKGGAASMITAGRILKELGYSGQYSIYFTWTIMEEDCDGLCWNYLIEKEKLIPDCALITEPTNLGLYRGHRGRMEIDINVTGKSCHGSAPERGINAIYKGSRIALEVEALHEKLVTDDFLGKGSVTVTQILSASPSLCAVPDFCQLHLDRRLTWGETKESALHELEEFLPDNSFLSVPFFEKPSYKGIIFKQQQYFPTWKLTEDHPYVITGKQTYRELFDVDVRLDKWTFSTNAVAICGKHNIPTIGFGPGDEVLAHAPNERVPVDHLVQASAFYALFPFILDQSSV